MVNSSAEPVNHSSSEPLEQPLTREAKQSINSGFRTSLGLPEQSGELVQEVSFRKLQISQMNVKDFETLDAARKSAWYIVSTESFAQDLLTEKYDVWKLRDGPEDCQIILMTTFEVFPGAKFLNVHFMAGQNVGKYREIILPALGDLMRSWECEAVIYMAANEAYARRLGGQKLTTLYRLDEETLYGKPEGSNTDLEERAVG